jgi:hypothetical protein
MPVEQLGAAYVGALEVIVPLRLKKFACARVNMASRKYEALCAEYKRAGWNQKPRHELLGRN